MKCYFCKKPVKPQNDFLTIAGSGESIHRECHNMVVHPPKIQCPVCKKIVEIHHTFGNGMELTRDSIEYHHKPHPIDMDAVNHPFKPFSNSKKERAFQARMSERSINAICPYSDLNLDKVDDSTWQTRTMKKEMLKVVRDKK